MPADHEPPSTSEANADVVVGDVVNSVVDSVAARTGAQQPTRMSANDALLAEKARVQKLINGLVKKVTSPDTPKSNGAPSKQDEAESPRSARAATATATSASAPGSPGVRLDDHRIFHLTNTAISWTQSNDSVTVCIAVPSWVRKEHVRVALKPGSVAIRAAFAPTADAVFELSEPLFGAIDADSSMWMLDGAGTERNITLELEKARIRWWSRLFMADDPTRYVPVENKKAALALSSCAPGSPLSPEANSPSPPPPPPADEMYSAASGNGVPPPPDHPPPQDSLPPTPAQDHESNGTVTASTNTSASASAGMGTNHSVKRQVEHILEQVVESVAKANGNSEPSARRVTLSQHSGTVHRTGGASAAGASRRTFSGVPSSANVRRVLETNIAEVEANGPKAAAAALQVGMVYVHGPYGMEKNEALAMRYLKLGLELGALNADAAFQLGMLYNSGVPGTPPDYAQAVRWWTVATELGHPVSMFNLGVMKMNGTGCDMDPIGALECFSRAHALNPRLRPPPLSQELIAERVATAARLRKERARLALSPEEREEIRAAAMRDIRLVAMGTGALAAVTGGLFALRHWWRNTL